MEIIRDSNINANLHIKQHKNMDSYFIDAFFLGRPSRAVTTRSLRKRKRTQTRRSIPACAALRQASLPAETMAKTFFNFNPTNIKIYKYGIPLGFF